MFDDKDKYGKGQENDKYYLINHEFLYLIYEFIESFEYIYKDHKQKN